MPIPLGSWLKLAIAPLAASNAASCVRGVGPSVKKSPPAQTRPSFVRASALTEVNPEETPLIGGVNARREREAGDNPAKVPRCIPPPDYEVHPAHPTQRSHGT